MSQGKLKRSITYPKLLFYGLGTMVGGGFYALIGKVSGEADMLAPFAFLLAGTIALINAFTYGELSSRYPVSAGEAHYVLEAFNLKWLSLTVGILVVITGIVSAATLSVATIGFLRDLVSVPEKLGIIILVLLMGGLCAWGIGQSVWAVLIITAIEVGALIFVVAISAENFSDISRIIEPQNSSVLNGMLLAGILSGAFLGFYAFIGFEDLANMAEEVKEAKKTLPKAILGSVILTTLVYIVVSAVSVLTVSPQELATASTPLARVVEGTWKHSTTLLIAVSMLTGINGALVQIIMASRVLYGLGKKAKFLNLFSEVNPVTHTPIRATILSVGCILVLSLLFSLVSLAEVTSAVILTIFGLLNISLIRIKRKKEKKPADTKTFPIWLPVLGFICCAGLLGFKIWTMIFTGNGNGL